MYLFFVVLLLTIAESACPSGGGIICYPEDCSFQYQQCADNIFYAPEDTPPGFLCSNNVFVFPSFCTPTNTCTTPSCSLSQILTSDEFYSLFPHANGGAYSGEPNQYAVFDYDKLVSAAQKYPEFVCSGSAETRRRELAAFLAQTSQETSGWWSGQPYSWGYYFSTELGCTNGYDCPQYCKDDDSTYPCSEGQGYFGRGPMQLSWNYNYGKASEALFGDKQILLDNPDLLFTNDTAFETALWFWMTPQDQKPSCHQVMTDEWTPSEDDVISGRFPGFGMTINIINGGLECSVPTPQTAENRVQYYLTYTSLLGVDPGSNLYCDNMEHY